MITPEGIKLLNSILYDFPTDRMFSISEYTSNKKAGHNYDREITDYLLAEKFVKFERSNILSRHNEKRELSLLEKGFDLQNAGSYEAFTSPQKITVDNQIRQYNITERLTLIVAIWTFVAGLYYAMEIFDYFIPNLPCIYNKAAMVLIPVLGLGIIGGYLLKEHLPMFGRTKQ